MDILLSFDYEIFFKDNKYNSIRSLISPTNRLLKIMDTHGVEATFFVDAGYLLALEMYKYDKNIETELKETVRQVGEIERSGHEIGLHVHSHWEDTTWENNRWRFDMQRYKLSDFDQIDVGNIFNRYYNHLNQLIKSDIRSFRAGGWCLEPFENIRQPMIDCGISIDSTVYHGGKRNSLTHYFDFCNYPKKNIWNFNDHPRIENENGIFKEVSMTAMEMNFMAYWKMIYRKLLNKMVVDNNGKGISPPLTEIAKNLFRKSTMPVSADTVKSSFLMNEFKRRENQGDDFFSVISHPKNMDAESMKIFDEFVSYAKGNGHNFYPISKI